ncbi:hypothetical protein [Cyanobium sp. NIES-981]|uniref:hypothetical protein n=1 Tax=Cyanobium sp. NIES-981 TaxID=1851505 RepID=UPI001CEC6F03|nr:hypothetical protein [Cyanobium sp. NIES-981]
MAFPTPSHPASSHPESAHALPSAARRNGGRPTAASVEGDHQREKLEFALAVALSRGEQERCLALRQQIALLGEGGVEPGT